jgi:hypothetical protein
MDLVASGNRPSKGVDKKVVQAAEEPPFLPTHIHEVLLEIKTAGKRTRAQILEDPMIR